MRNYIFLLFILLAAACVRENGRLEKALVLAGKNRAELEQVLEHYSREKADSLKYRAAVFLIENMPGHCSYVSDEITTFREEYERIFFDNQLTVARKEAELEFLSAHYNLEANVAEDAEIITAAYLIDNIDRSFDTWQHGRYCQHLNFDEFCELILPYKCVELQEMDNWKEVLAGAYDRTNLILPNDETWSNPYYAAKILTEYYGVHKKNYIPEYSGYTLRNKNTFLNTQVGTCGDFSLSAVALMRSKGIPACFEKTPRWGGQGPVGHAWHTILNDNGIYLPAPWNLESLPGDVFFPTQKIPKIFRQTYAANPFYEEYSEQSLLKLPVFHKFIIAKTKSIDFED